jgi:riboflavin kinase/FMN adenylyltransferase
MQIIKNLDLITDLAPGAVATIGNFDGVHQGHREIFRRIVAEARRRDCLSMVVTFTPHPMKLLDPEKAPRLLNTYAEKERLIAASCVDILVEIPFNQAIAKMSPTAFIKNILVQKLRISHLVVGYDYTFGRDRGGDSELLKTVGQQEGFSVETVGPVLRDAVISSSTQIRKLLSAGDVAAVVGPLGRHFTLEGRVIRGVGRGQGLGFPTANLATEKEILPRPGVYAVKVRLHDEMYDAVMNIGFNPTFGTERISLEVHLLDFSADLYGEMLRVYFVERLRDEQVFASVDHLIKAIKMDISQARTILSQRNVVVYREYLKYDRNGTK